MSPYPFPLLGNARIGRKWAIFSLLGEILGRLENWANMGHLPTILGGLLGKMREADEHGKYENCAKMGHVRSLLSEKSLGNSRLGRKWAMFTVFWGSIPGKMRDLGENGSY